MKIIQEEQCICVKNEEGTYGFWAVGDNVIRAVYTMAEEVQNPSGMILDDVRASFGRLECEEADGGVRIRNQKIAVFLEEQTGFCTWYETKTGKVLCRENRKTLVPKEVFRYSTCGEIPIVRREKTVDGERSFIENLKRVKEGNAYRGQLGFAFREKEGIHGLGQGEEGIYDYRRCSQYLYQHNMRIPMPFLVSDKGYGILTDCGSLMTWEADEDGGYLFLDTVAQLDYYVIAGECLDDVIRGYRMLTGRAAMLPKWAFGYIQSKEAYHTAQELLEVGLEYRRRKIPLDCVVQDWNTWEAGKWGNKKLDAVRYGNVKEINEQLHAQNIHTMVSIWPNMGEGCEDHAEMAEAGCLLGDNSTYDAFCSKARDLYWEQLRDSLWAGGFDSWWCDSTEPFSGPDWNGEVKREPWERYVLVGEEHKKYLDSANANLYALAHTRGIYENQRKETEERRVLILSRSGYASQQRYGTILWSGDISASWKTLRKQIPEGLNMCMSGIPYWTLDAGAFFVEGADQNKQGCKDSSDPKNSWFWDGAYKDGVRDRGYCELYVRWLQYAAFLPIFRSHGTDTPREIWNFGEKGELFYDAIASAIRLRYALMDYIYSMAGRVTHQDATMMRSLIFDYAEDEKARTLGTEYLFGESLLVCPVTEPMYYEAGNQALDREKKWSCYLPAGNGWYDFWTDRYYEGGQTVLADAPLDRIPLFVKAGSILPIIREPIQYASQQKKEPLFLKVYPGADAEYLHYLDDGDGYGYEQGVYSFKRFIWKEQEWKLEGEIGTDSFSYEICDPKGT